MSKVKPTMQTATFKGKSKSRKDLVKVYLEPNKFTSVNSNKNANNFLSDSSPTKNHGSPKIDSPKEIMSKYPSSKIELPLISPTKLPRNTINSKKHQNYLLKSDNEMFKVCETSPNQGPFSPSIALTNQTRKPIKIQAPKKHLTVFDNSPYHSKKFRAMQNEISEQRNSEKKETANNFTSCVIALHSMKTLTEADASSPTNDNQIHYEISQPGKLIGNISKENQDSYLMLDDLFGFERCSIFGVMDGHGTNGHFVSRFIKQGAIDLFSQLDNYKGKKKNGIVTEAGIYEKVIAKNHQFITSFYVDMEEKLRDGKFDVHYSGSTCVMCFIIDGKLICSNTGDSRAILIKQNDQGIYSNEALSNDHKPNSPQEMNRIKAKGGLVIQDKDCAPQEGIYRVWTKSKDGPGIAISRTIGDEVAASIGVIPDPEIIEKYITNEMCYIVAGSDGIWDFIENDKVMNIINPFYIKNDPKGAATAIVQEATKLWIAEGGPIDDITCIIYFLRPFKKD